MERASRSLVEPAHDDLLALPLDVRRDEVTVFHELEARLPKHVVRVAPEDHEANDDAGVDELVRGPSQSPPDLHLEPAVRRNDPLREFGTEWYAAHEGWGEAAGAETEATQDGCRYPWPSALTPAKPGNPVAIGLGHADIVRASSHWRAPMQQVELSYKAIRFLLAALDLQRETWRARLADPDIGEDERADLGNDLAFLDAVRTDLARALD